MTTPDVGPAVRVLLVDDEPLIRSGFRFILGLDPSIEIVGEASDGGAAIELVRAHRPDVVLMDVRMPGMDGPDATAVIVAESTSRVLAMTSLDAEGQLLRMLLAGATGYLLKDESPARITEAVHRTALGESVFSAHSAAQLVRRAVESEHGQGRQAAVERISALTDRERDVAVRVASGETNHEIGAALHISAGTVKTHLEQVFAKLAVRNRVQVGVILERAGLGPADV
ncbi:response regulator [Microbacterium sp. 179-I 3D4 NHS]|uniref:response regulator n=1 Tax=Microbacterium sp. 179-I 3D4 NHS TaxID=3142381 RepID=UPI0039A07F08